ncbi:MAG: hypothetical protein U0470_13990 [Anaerolineae bacterium]
MRDHPPADPAGVPGHSAIAWPRELLYDDHRRLVGFLMPHVRDAVPILDVLNPRRRAATLPAFDLAYLHRCARNLASALNALHATRVVVGDLNERNVLVTPRALVTLIDADSFQIQRLRPAEIVFYPCPVGRAEYTPPELQGQPFRDAIRLPEHDAFGLAVLIFQLLMGGSHPFRSAWLGPGEAPPLEEKIRRGWFPYLERPAGPSRRRRAPPRSDGCIRAWSTPSRPPSRAATRTRASGRPPRPGRGASRRRKRISSTARRATPSPIHLGASPRVRRSAARRRLVGPPPSRRTDPQGRAPSAARRAADPPIHRAARPVGGIRPAPPPRPSAARAPRPDGSPAPREAPCSLPRRQPARPPASASSPARAPRRGRRSSPSRVRPGRPGRRWPRPPTGRPPERPPPTTPASPWGRWWADGLTGERRSWSPCSCAPSPGRRPLRARRRHRSDAGWPSTDSVGPSAGPAPR